MANSKNIRRDLDLSGVCDGNTIKLLTSHLQAVGVPKEYIFFPLLSCVSAFLGQSTVKIHDDWSESCALWTAIVARKGSKRSAVLDRFIDSLLTAIDPDDKEKASQDDSPMNINLIHDEAVEVGELKSNKRHLGLYENLSTSQLMETGNMSMAKKCYDSKRTKRQGSLSLFSFLPPEDAMTLLEDRNTDLISRFLVACPKSSVFKSTDMKSPMPINTPSLSKIFEVLNVIHEQPKTYSLDAEAKTAFDVYFDALQDGLVRFDGDDRNYGILAKAAGQLARLTTCLVVLRQALKIVVYKEESSLDNWNTEIGAEDIEAGRLIMDYVIDIRFTLLGKVSTSNAQRMCPSMLPQSIDTNVTHTIQAPTSTCSRDSENPPSKRARVAETETEASSVVAHSIPANEISRAQPVSITMRENPAATESNMFQIRPTANEMHNFSRGFVTDISVHNSSKRGNGKAHDSPQRQGDHIPTNGYFSNCAVEDDSYYMPSRRTNSYVNFSNLTETEMQSFTNEQQMFIRRFGYKLKKLLECKDEYSITPSSCVQRHLMPPIPKNELDKYDTQTRYPVIAAKEYLSKVAELGFGTIESTWHATNNRRSILFNKLTYDQLKDNAKRLLPLLGISIESYMAAFLRQQPGYGGSQTQMYDEEISSSSAYPLPYPTFRENQLQSCNERNVLSIFPENSGDSSESSGNPLHTFVKQEPLEYKQ